MKILNIYAQDMEHSEARIVGNREGLLALKLAIDRATAAPDDKLDPHPDQEPLFASDGEGFELIIEERNDRWGIVDGTGKEDPNSFWAKPESAPQYLYKERAVGIHAAVRFVFEELNHICHHNFINRVKAKRKRACAKCVAEIKSGWEAKPDGGGS